MKDIGKGIATIGIWLPLIFMSGNGIMLVALLCALATAVVWGGSE